MARIKEIEDIQSYGAITLPFNKVIIGGRYIPTLTFDVQTPPSFITRIFSKIFKPYTCVASERSSFCYDLDSGQYWTGPPGTVFKTSPIWTILGIGLLSFTGYMLFKKVVK